MFGLCALLGGQGAIGEQNPTVPKTIYYDYIDEKGELKGGFIVVEAEKIKVPETLLLDSEWDVTTIIDNGPIGNRVDLVFVGDGYTEPNLGVYATDVSNVINGFFAESPLDEYASFFNVHRVDVISTDSGVDNDPCDGISRDTALNMGFWRFDKEALLGWEPYAEVSLALAAAGQAPDNNYVLALANSKKYGGAGYKEGVGTACGHEEYGRTNKIALHESGHSFVGLGDEYFDPNGVEYPYEELLPEHDKANLSTHEAEDMNALQIKWYRWLGEQTVPDVNLIGTYEGAFVDYNSGIYRPTDWSMMRDLDYPFYQVNIEQFIFKIYELVKPIDYATPEGTYAIGTQFFVQPVKPATHSLDVT